MSQKNSGGGGPRQPLPREAEADQSKAASTSVSEPLGGATNALGCASAGARPCDVGDGIEGDCRGACGRASRAIRDGRALGVSLAVAVRGAARDSPNAPSAASSSRWPACSAAIPNSIHMRHWAADGLAPSAGSRTGRKACETRSVEGRYMRGMVRPPDLHGARGRTARSRAHSTASGRVPRAPGCRGSRLAPLPDKGMRRLPRSRPRRARR